MFPKSTSWAATFMLPLCLLAGPAQVSSGVDVTLEAASGFRGGAQRGQALHGLALVHTDWAYLGNSPEGSRPTSSRSTPPSRPRGPARAGAGIAVVAEEVRALAQRSATAAKETADKIDDSVAKSRHGAEVCAKVAAGLNEIATKSRQVDELVGEISTASLEQTSGIEQVNSAVSQMDKVVQASAARAEEGARVAEDLTAQSTALQKSVDELNHLVGGKIAASSNTHAAHRPAAAIRAETKQAVFANS